MPSLHSIQMSLMPMGIFILFLSVLVGVGCLKRPRRTLTDLRFSSPRWKIGSRSSPRGRNEILEPAVKNTAGKPLWYKALFQALSGLGYTRAPCSYIESFAWQACSARTHWRVAFRTSVPVWSRYVIEVGVGRVLPPR